MTPCTVPLPLTNYTEPVPSDLQIVYPETFKYYCVIGYTTTDPLTLTCHKNGTTHPAFAPNCTGKILYLKVMAIILVGKELFEE